MQIDPAVPMGTFAGQRWKIIADGKTHVAVEIAISAFDEIDAKEEGSYRCEMLLDFLSVHTNCSFTRQHFRPSVDWALPVDVNRYLKDETWIDGLPLEDGALRLPCHALSLCDALLTHSGSGLLRLAAASKLFHQALSLSSGHILQVLPGWHALDIGEPDLKFGGQIIGDRFADTVGTLLVSSLEVASLTEKAQPTCAACSQPIYKISERVSKLAKRHLGDEFEWQIKQYYNRRSKLLHVGRGRGSRTHQAYIVPQLDPNSETGCVMPHMREHAMLEHVSYILRGEYRLLADPA